MCKLLMSINPQHVDNILAGTKRYEYRKTKCKEPVDAIIIYATAPIMKVVAEVEVLDVIEDSPKIVWNMTYESAGIEKHFFDTYYAGRNKAVAYVLGKVKRYKYPQFLSDYGIKAAPQSYVYIREQSANT